MDADLLNERNHYVIFPEKVFVIDRRSKAQYDEAVGYGLFIGIPPPQLDRVVKLDRLQGEDARRRLCKNEASK